MSYGWRGNIEGRRIRVLYDEISEGTAEVEGLEDRVGVAEERINKI